MKVSSSSAIVITMWPLQTCEVGKEDVAVTSLKVIKFRNKDDGASRSTSGLLVQSTFLLLHRGKEMAKLLCSELVRLWPRRSSRILPVPYGDCDVRLGMGWVRSSSPLDRIGVLEHGRPRFESRFCHSQLYDFKVNYVFVSFLLQFPHRKWIAMRIKYLAIPEKCSQWQYPSLLGDIYRQVN